MEKTFFYKVIQLILLVKKASSQESLLFIQVKAE